MLPLRLESLVEVFAQVPDPRKARGIRHPLQGMLALVFLGLLARIREMAVLQRWAKTHWHQLQEPLGFERDEPPHATTISRTIAGCELSKFAAAFLAWVKTVVPDEPLAVAVDAKTSCQGIGEDGQPVQLLTVLVHNMKLVLAQWSVHGEKTNEPNVLRNHLAELTAEFPLLKLITGDAIYAQRPLAEALLDENCDYLLQIKGNQADIQDAVQNCLGTAHERKPAAQMAEKKGTPWIGASSGWI
jgi:DDE family transposase